MRTKVTLILLFLNVVLFFFIFQFERRSRIEEGWKNARANVLGAEATDIREIEVAGGPNTLALAKRPDGWYVTSPLEWPANPNAVNRILNELQSLKHETSFNVADLGKNGQSLADYGLDKPILTVTLKSGDPTSPSKDHPSTHETRLRIGDVTKDNQRVYLLSPDGERIHVVGASLVRSLALTFDDLRSDAVFTIPVFEARSLNLQTAAPASLKIRVRRDGSRWSFETPIVARVSKTAVELAINGLNGLHVDSFITANPPATLPNEKPSLRVTLEGNNRRETLILGDPAPAADSHGGAQTFYAQLEGRSALFTLSLPDDLLKTLRTAQVALRETRILDFDPAGVTAISLAAPNQPELVLQRLETGARSADAPAWQIVRRGEAAAGPQTQPADRAAVQRLIEILGRLNAKEQSAPARTTATADAGTEPVRDHGFKSDAPTAADLETWGFNRPEREVTLTLVGGTTPLSLQLGTDASRNVYARLGTAANPGSSIYAVDADILRELPVAPRAWRERVLRELPAGARLTAIKLTDLASGQVLVDTAIEPSGKPAPGAPHAEAVATIVTQLKTLRARSFIQDQFTDKVAVAGEERPWRFKLEATATLVGGAGEQTSVTTLFLSPRVGGDIQLAGSPANEFNAVFSIEQPLLDALWTITEAPHDPGPAPAK